jgi:hypothetical protein
MIESKGEFSVKRLILGIVCFVILCSSIAYGVDCKVTEETMGFRDWEALKLGWAAEVYKQGTGDAAPQRQVAYKLMAEGKLVDLSKGEKAELLKVDQIREETVMQIKVKGKGIMWIMGIDLVCK